MDKGIYTALSGGIAKTHELELIANNLANANTPGFKRDTGTFNEYLTEFRRPDNAEGLQRDIRADINLDGRPTGDKSFVEMDGVYTDYGQGTLQQTNRPLDLALEGGGFFEVLTPAGIRYTRQGNFSVSAEGELVTSSGHPVLSRSTEAANAEPETRIIKLQQGQVRITEEGIIQQNGRRVGQLSIQAFNEPQWLEKMGNSLYRNTHPANLTKPDPHHQVHQGFLEGSNVNAVLEMTRLIDVTRSYESHMQAIKTYQEIDNRTANDIVRGGQG